MSKRVTHDQGQDHLSEGWWYLVKVDGVVVAQGRDYIDPEKMSEDLTRDIEVAKADLVLQEATLEHAATQPRAVFVVAVSLQLAEDACSFVRRRWKVSDQVNVEPVVAYGQVPDARCVGTCFVGLDLRDSELKKWALSSGLDTTNTTVLGCQNSHYLRRAKDLLAL